jgi:hypothetical protein
LTERTSEALPASQSAAHRLPREPFLSLSCAKRRQGLCLAGLPSERREPMGEPPPLHEAEALGSPFFLQSIVGCKIDVSVSVAPRPPLEGLCGETLQWAIQITSRSQVFWEGDNEYYHGRVVGVDPQRGSIVKYDSGEFDVHNLSKEGFILRSKLVWARENETSNSWWPALTTLFSPHHCTRGSWERQQSGDVQVSMFPDGATAWVASSCLLPFDTPPANPAALSLVEATIRAMREQRAMERVRRRWLMQLLPLPALVFFTGSAPSNSPSSFQRRWVWLLSNGQRTRIWVQRFSRVSGAFLCRAAPPLDGDEGTLGQTAGWLHLSAFQPELEAPSDRLADLALPLRQQGVPPRCVVDGNRITLRGLVAHGCTRALPTPTIVAPAGDVSTLCESALEAQDAASSSSPAAAATEEPSEEDESALQGSLPHTRTATRLPAWWHSTGSRCSVLVLSGTDGWGRVPALSAAPLCPQGPPGLLVRCAACTLQFHPIVCAEQSPSLAFDWAVSGCLPRHAWCPESEEVSMLAEWLGGKQSAAVAIRAKAKVNSENEPPPCPEAEFWMDDADVDEAFEQLPESSDRSRLHLVQRWFLERKQHIVSTPRGKQVGSSADTSGLSSALSHIATACSPWPWPKGQHAVQWQSEPVPVGEVGQVLSRWHRWESGEPCHTGQRASAAVTGWLCPQCEACGSCGSHAADPDVDPLVARLVRPVDPAVGFGAARGALMPWAFEPEFAKAAPALQLALSWQRANRTLSAAASDVSGSAIAGSTEDDDFVAADSTFLFSPTMAAKVAPWRLRFYPSISLPSHAGLSRCLPGSRELRPLLDVTGDHAGKSYALAVTPALELSRRAAALRKFQIAGGDAVAMADGRIKHKPKPKPAPEKDRKAKPPSPSQAAAPTPQGGFSSREPTTEQEAERDDYQTDVSSHPEWTARKSDVWLRGGGPFQAWPVDRRDVLCPPWRYREAEDAVNHGCSLPPLGLGDLPHAPPPRPICLCSDCHPRFQSTEYCPVTLQAYSKDSLHMIGCEACGMWVHAATDGFSHQHILLLGEARHPHFGGAYVCPLCRAALLARSLSFLIHDDRSGIFSSPVTDEQAPGYSDVVDRPMDLATVSTRLADGVYSGTMGPQRFRVDIEQIALNALKYNTRGDRLWREATRFLESAATILDAVFPFTHNGSFSDQFKALLGGPPPGRPQQPWQSMSAPSSAGALAPGVRGAELLEQELSVRMHKEAEVPKTPRVDVEPAPAPPQAPPVSNEPVALWDELTAGKVVPISGSAVGGWKAVLCLPSHLAQWASTADLCSLTGVIVRPWDCRICIMCGEAFLETSLQGSLPSRKVEGRHWHPGETGMGDPRTGEWMCCLCCTAAGSKHAVEAILARSSSESGTIGSWLAQAAVEETNLMGAVLTKPVQEVRPPADSVPEATWPWKWGSDPPKEEEGAEEAPSEGTEQHAMAVQLSIARVLIASGLPPTVQIFSSPVFRSALQHAARSAHARRIAIRQARRAAAVGAAVGSASSAAAFINSSAQQQGAAVAASVLGQSLPASVSPAGSFPWEGATTGASAPLVQQLAPTEAQRAPLFTSIAERLAEASEAAMELQLSGWPSCLPPWETCQAAKSALVQMLRAELPCAAPFRTALQQWVEAGRAVRLTHPPEPKRPRAASSSGGQQLAMSEDTSTTTIESSSSSAVVVEDDGAAVTRKRPREDDQTFAKTFHQVCVMSDEESQQLGGLSKHLELPQWMLERAREFCIALGWTMPEATALSDALATCRAELVPALSCPGAAALLVCTFKSASTSRGDLVGERPNVAGRVVELLPPKATIEDVCVASAVVPENATPATAIATASALVSLKRREEFLFSSNQGQLTSISALQRPPVIARPFPLAGFVDRASSKDVLCTAATDAKTGASRPLSLFPSSSLARQCLDAAEDPFWTAAPNPVPNLREDQHVALHLSSLSPWIPAVIRGAFTRWYLSMLIERSGASSDARLTIEGDPALLPLDETVPLSARGPPTLFDWAVAGHRARDPALVQLSAVSTRRLVAEGMEASRVGRGEARVRMINAGTCTPGDFGCKEQTRAWGALVESLGAVGATESLGTYAAALLASAGGDPRPPVGWDPSSFGGGLDAAELGATSLSIPLASAATASLAAREASASSSNGTEGARARARRPASSSPSAPAALATQQPATPVEAGFSADLDAVEQLLDPDALGSLKARPQNLSTPLRQELRATRVLPDTWCSRAFPTDSARPGGVSSCDGEAAATLASQCEQAWGRLRADLVHGATKPFSTLRAGTISLLTIGRILPLPMGRRFFDRQGGQFVPIPLGFATRRVWWSPRGSRLRCTWTCSVSLRLEFETEGASLVPWYAVQCDEDFPGVPGHRVLVEGMSMDGKCRGVVMVMFQCLFRSCVCSSPIYRGQLAWDALPQPGGGRHGVAVPRRLLVLWPPRPLHPRLHHEPPRGRAAVRGEGPRARHGGPPPERPDGAHSALPPLPLTPRDPLECIPRGSVSHHPGEPEASGSELEHAWPCARGRGHLAGV